MSEKIHLNKLTRDLISKDYEVQVQASEEVCNLFSGLAEKCVEALIVSDNPFLIAERLSGLGTRIIPPLETFVQTGDEKRTEKKVLASIVLLNLGSKAGLNYVVEELRNTGENQYLAARVLVTRKIPAAEDLIIERLQKFSLSELKDEKESTFVSNLLSYLKELGVPLPADLAQRFESITNSEVHKYYVEYL